MDKPGNKLWKTQARPLADILRNTIKDAFAKQGFAATELVTRWGEIVGPEISAHCEPEKIQWPRPYGGDDQQPGTLVLRVEGPTAIEIQHLSRIILERVNRFFGWQAVTDLRLRQAPLGRREKSKAAGRGSRSGGAHRILAHRDQRREPPAGARASRRRGHEVLTPHQSGVTT